MDQDRDGTVSLDDLKEVYASLGNKIKNKIFFLLMHFFLISGKAPKDTELKSMLEEAQGPVNFTMLLTLFGDRLNGTDEENVILNAWKNFDQEGTGAINQKRFQ
jgi:Ca2+-binding EF-hand superfamily protein